MQRGVRIPVNSFAVCGLVDIFRLFLLCTVQASQPSGSFSFSLEVRFIFRIGGKDVKRGVFFDFLSQVL